MSNFDLKKITAIKGRQVFYQLTIDDNPVYDGVETEEEKNEKKTGILDIYESQLEKRYKKDLRMIYTYMIRVANNMQVSGAKYHELDRPKNDPVKDYEFKHGDLRVYAFKIHNGKIFVHGGFKNSQAKDIAILRSLKKQYLESLKS